MTSSDIFSLRKTYALSTWFSKTDLDAAKQLCDQALSLIMRHSSGVVLPESNISAAVIFKDSRRTKEGFAITSSFCSSCGEAQKIPYCRHIAVAALLALIPLTTRDDQPHPAPVLFANSPWHAMASHLFVHYRKSPGHLAFGPKESIVFSLTPAGENDPCFTITLPKQYAHLIVTLHKNLPETNAAANAEVASLHTWQQRRTATTTEQQLNNHGSFSMGQRQDASLPFLLMGLLANKLADTEIIFSAKDSSFHLDATDHDGRYSCRLRLASDSRSEKLLNSLAGNLPSLPLRPDAAQEYMQIRFNDDGSLLCTPSIRLADGRTFTREELFPSEFGNLFYLPGDGLRKIKALGHDETIRPIKAATASLFDFAAPKARTGSPFTIANDQVNLFVEQNKIGLHCPDNDIGQNLLNLKLCDKPDNLQIESCDQDELGWHYLAGYYGMGNKKIPLLEILLGQEKGMDYLPGSGLRLCHSPLSWFYELGRERFWQQDGKDAGVKLTSLELLRLTSQFTDIELPEKNERLSSLLSPENWQAKDKLPACPKHLRDYQINGLAWLYSLYRHGLGGILADDMGLGKTHQAMALIWLICRNEPDASFLVVCPASVASHWQMKAADFYPDLRVQLYHGAGRAIVDKSQVIITTYGLLSRDSQLRDHHFTTIFFDEMQHLKNSKTKAHQAALGLHSSSRIGLTGTPIENSSLDLKNLLNICLPGLLGSDKQFNQRYGKGAAPEQLAELAALLSPFILRRDRQQVLRELPDVIDDIHTCELTDDQVALYRQAIGEQGKELRAALADSTAKVNYADVLSMITRLKQICNHPNLLHPDQEYSSGKWELFVELLADCLDARLKVVVFSQYTSMLDIIEKYLDESRIKYASLHGSMDLTTRTAMLARFQNDPDCLVFCASLLAGGVGVDLTAAQVVIHYDRWWNAAREDQATARVHRMGQKKVVQVIRLITNGTLEEKIHHLIAQRRELAAQLIKNDDETMAKKLSRRDLLELLDWSES